MRRMNTLILAVIGALSITLAATAGADYEITSFTIDGGGGKSAQDGFALEGTIGQPDGGPALSGDEWTLCGGFWPAAGGGFDPCPGDLDDDGSVAVSDLLSLLGAWGPCGPPCPEDLDDDGFVAVADLLALLGAWGACP